MTTIETMAGQINEELARLFMTYDTKLLGIALFIRGAHALRACHSTGVWQLSDVRELVDDTLQDIYTPLPEDERPQGGTPAAMTGTMQ